MVAEAHSAHPLPSSLACEANDSSAADTTTATAHATSRFGGVHFAGMSWGGMWGGYGTATRSGLVVEGGAPISGSGMVDGGADGTGDDDEESKRLLEDQTSGKGGDGVAGADNGDPLANPFHIGTIALVMCTFVFNLVGKINGIPTTYYMYDVLDMDGQTKYVYNIFTSLPECLRVLMVVAILIAPTTFKRKKVFWAVGILIYCGQYLILARADGNITLAEYETWGYFGKFGDNIYNAMLTMLTAERTRLEPVNRRGTIVIACLVAENLGSFLGYMFDEVFYEHAFGWGGDVVLTVKSCAYIVAVVPPLTILPFIYFFEETASEPKSLSGILRELFSAVTSPDVLMYFMILMVQDILDISNGDEDTLILDGCEVRSQPYLVWKMIQMAMLVLAVLFYRFVLFNQSFAYMTVFAMIFYRFCLLNELWLVYDDGDNVLYESPTNCLIYYGTLNIAYECVNQFKDGSKNIIEMMMVASSATRGSAVTSLFASMDSTMSLINSIISDELLDAWPDQTSSSAIENGDFYGFTRVQLIICLVPIVFQVGTSLKFPHSRKEHADLSAAQATDSGSGDMSWLASVVWYKPWTWTKHIAVAWCMIGSWLFGVVFAYWWTWWDDITDDDQLEGRPGWQQTFVVVCIGYYVVACTASVFIMFGALDYLKRRPNNDANVPTPGGEGASILGDGGSPAVAVSDHQTFEKLARGDEQEWGDYVKSNSFQGGGAGVSRSAP